MNRFIQIIKLLLLVAALAIAYLFALNGRYSHIDDDWYFDKWTKTIFEGIDEN